MGKIDTELGKIIKEFRIKKGLTQKELAIRSGISISAIQQIEYGKLRPKIDTLVVILGQLDLDCDIWLQNNSFSIRYDEEDKQTLISKSSLHPEYHLYINYDYDDIEIENIKERNKKYEESMKPFKTLIYNFNSVNEGGQQKIVDYSSDIAENPKYKKDK